MLQGMVCIVSGASSDIGRETVLELLREGAHVYAGSRRLDLLTEFQDSWVKTFGGSRVWVKRLDVTDENNVRDFVEDVISRHGRVDALINLAGYPMDRDLWNRGLTDLDWEDISKVFRVDLGGSFLLSKYVIPFMVKNKHGVIVNISSTPAIAGYDRGCAYTIAKAALLGLTKHIASEYGRMGVRAYTLALGNIETSTTKTALQDSYEKLAQESPAGRWGKPSEVASVISVLCSDKMSFVNGQTIVVDGGTIMF
jgi:NAD(P)-dependent dehydrogenase (short-subunit alcohol dehydrogenase family)